MDERARWYKDLCFYRVFPRSFLDGNGDGIGDLWGLKDRLDYIQSLQADGIWLSSVCPSMNRDIGRDVTDFCAVAEEYGGMEAFLALLEELHRRGMKLILDLELSCTGTEHPWFRASEQGEKPYKYYYIWRPAGERGRAPNNWQNIYSESAWSWSGERKAYYLHLQGENQPDLNMRNPEVRAEIKKIMRFWLDLGVDGFREDRLNLISKPKELPEGLPLWPLRRGSRHYDRGPFLRSYLQEFRHDVLDRYNCLTVGDLGSVGAQEARDYADEPDGELDLVLHRDYFRGDSLFNGLFHTRFSLLRQRFYWDRWQRAMAEKGWNILCLENEDTPRSVSRFGSEKLRTASGKALAAAVLFQRGTPLLYQGQEIGMTNIRLDSVDWYQDDESLRLYRRARTRDDKKRLERVWRGSRQSARSPMQWSDGDDAGFTTGEPWFYVNQNYRSVNVAQQDGDADSLLNFYRKALTLRREMNVVRTGSYRDLRPLSPWFYVYERTNRSGRLLVMCSFASVARLLVCPREYELKKGELLLSTHGDALEGRNVYLKPYECRVYWFPGSRKAQLEEAKAQKKTTRFRAAWKKFREYLRSFREFYDDYEDEP
ncbi:MAG: alpha-amylase family glycosyl hydrolase [Oscillospiraceae bacterium]|nr:alpha-amylase family glycosyl hydrolase [Oscillospiraceae bacterium]